MRVHLSFVHVPSAAAPCRLMRVMRIAMYGGSAPVAQYSSPSFSLCRNYCEVRSVM